MGKSISIQDYMEDTKWDYNIAKSMGKGKERYAWKLVHSVQEINNA